MAKNNKHDERDDLAGEYVLGSLSASERVDVELRMKTDPALAAAVGRWQSRLEPLLETVPPVSVPKGQLDAVFGKIDDCSTPRQQGQIIRLRQRVRRWQGAALAASAIAASLLIFVALERFATNPVPVPGGNFIAVLQADDRTPHFVASVDFKRGRIDVVRLGPVPTPGNAYELWAVGGGRAKPQSLGLVNATISLPTERLGKTTKRDLRNTVFAVSREPAGGSPSGQPTGPILFTGRLVPAADQ